MNRLSGRGKSGEKEKAKQTKGENERRDGKGVGISFIFALFPTAEPVHRLTRHTRAEVNKENPGFIAYH